jgi:pyruvate formate lyase activating enzyme
MGESKYEKLGMEYKLKGVPPMDKKILLEKKQVILDGIRKRREEM